MEWFFEFVLAVGVAGSIAYAVSRKASKKRSDAARLLSDAELEQKVFWLNADDKFSSEYHDEAARRAEAKRLMERAK